MAERLDTDVGLTETPRNGFEAWQGDGNLFIQDDGKLMGRFTSYQAYKRL